MMNRLNLAGATAVVGALVGPAAAGPSGTHEPASYVGGMVSFGAAEPIDGYTVMADGEGGHEVAGPLWLHVQAGYGPSIDRFGGHDVDASTTVRAQIGAELRACTRASELCLVGGADAGVQYAAYPTTAYPSGDAITYHDLAFVLVPRIGFDSGSEHIRVRLTAGAPVAIVRREDAMPYGPSGHVEGIDLAAGVAYQW